jgi:hypothetical protein
MMWRKTCVEKNYLALCLRQKAMWRKACAKKRYLQCDLHQNDTVVQGLSEELQSGALSSPGIRCDARRAEKNIFGT